MLSLPPVTLLCFGAWMALGLLAHALYGYRKSRLARGVVNLAPLREWAVGAGRRGRRSDGHDRRIERARCRGLPGWRWTRRRAAPRAGWG
jgi:hypothetical protein